ncbi:MAG: hypothetical protein HY870_15380 [Chloroflexi bacterium]|nr:hypothetical protein [Chloroflexota bacterium]
MNTVSKWIRIVHRWLVIPFVLMAITAIFSTASGDNTSSPPWMIVMLILSLLSLLVTGLYMFAQHYLRKARRARTESVS